MPIVCANFSLEILPKPRARFSFGTSLRNMIGGGARHPPPITLIVCATMWSNQVQKAMQAVGKARRTHAFWDQHVRIYEGILARAKKCTLMAPKLQEEYS